jgi:hypothetical protein
MKTLIASLIALAAISSVTLPANAGFGPRDITPQDTSAGFGPRDLPEPVGPAFGPRDITTQDTSAARSPWDGFGTSTGEGK